MLIDFVAKIPNNYRTGKRVALFEARSFLVRISPRHAGLRPTRRGVDSSQGRWPCADLRPARLHHQYMHHQYMHHRYMHHHVFAAIVLKTMNCGNFSIIYGKDLHNMIIVFTFALRLKHNRLMVHLNLYR